MKLLPTLIAAALLAANLSAHAAPKTTPSRAAQKAATQPQTADDNFQEMHVQEEDLRGMWADLTENGDDYLFNSTTMNPDTHTGMDVAVIKIGKPATKVVILQKFTWTFDEAKQELTQTTTDFAVQRDNGKREVQKDKIGKCKTGSVKMLSLNGERAVLQIQDAGTSDRKNRAVYVKMDDQKILDAMRAAESAKAAK